MSKWRCASCHLTLSWDGNPGPCRGGSCPGEPWGSDLPGWMLTDDHDWIELTVDNRFFAMEWEE